MFKGLKRRAKCAKRYFAKRQRSRPFRRYTQYTKFICIKAQLFSTSHYLHNTRISNKPPPPTHLQITTYSVKLQWRDCEDLMKIAADMLCEVSVKFLIFAINLPHPPAYKLRQNRWSYNKGTVKIRWRLQPIRSVKIWWITKYSFDFLFLFSYFI